MQNYFYEDLFIKENISIQPSKQSQQRLVWGNQIAFLPDWTQAESVNINFILSLSIPGILCAPVITLLLRQVEERWRNTNSKVTCHIMQLPICQHYLIGQLKKNDEKAEKNETNSVISLFLLHVFNLRDSRNWF